MTRQLDRIKLVVVVGELDDHCAAVDFVHATQPDLVVFNVGAPFLEKSASAIEVLKHLKVRFPVLQIIVLTLLARPSFQHQCIDLGAIACIDVAYEFNTLFRLVAQLADESQN